MPKAKAARLRPESIVLFHLIYMEKSTLSAKNCRMENMGVPQQPLMFWVVIIQLED